MLAAIKLATNPDVVLMAMDTVTREADCWTANDRWSRIVDVLMERLHLLKAGDKLHRPIVVLLSELESRGRLSKAEKKELRHAKEKIQEVSLSLLEALMIARYRNPEYPGGCKYQYAGCGAGY
jgi:hypothetical protein